MHIIINNSSMVPIYEQIIDQIKSAIIRGELQPDTVLRTDRVADQGADHLRRVKRK